MSIAYTTISITTLCTSMTYTSTLFIITILILFFHQGTLYQPLLVLDNHYTLLKALALSDYNHVKIHCITYNNMVTSSRGTSIYSKQK